MGQSWRPKSKLKIWGCSWRSPMPFKFAVKKSYTHDSIVMPLIAKKPKNAMSTEMWRNEIYTKRMMSENKVASDNFDNVELNVHSHD